VDFNFQNRRNAVVFAGIATLFSIAYVLLVISAWRSDTLLSRGDRQSLERAARLEQWNAQPHWKLGTYFLAVSEDPGSALSSLHRATALNPYSARYWLDVAAAAQALGNFQENSSALEHALQAEPTAPDVAWEAANFYLAQNDTARALPLLRVVVESDTTGRIPTALALSWRASQSVPQIVADVLPPQSSSYFSLLRILIADKASGPANQLWSALVATRIPFPVANAFPYFDYLINTHQIDQAEQVWKSLGDRDSELRERVDSNLVNDSGFERTYLNGGFGWRSDPDRQVQASLDTSEFHSGTRSLKLVFSGPAVSDTGIFEYVPVRPSTVYKLSAFVKSEDIISASGPRLVVQDMYSNKILATTDDMLGTSGWRQQVINLTTEPETRLVILKVSRVPGNPLIKGAFWLDDVSLVPAPLSEANR